MELEFHQLDLRYEGLRVRRAEREHRLLAALAECGQQVPIVVVTLGGEPEHFLVIDGYKRIRALKRLGRDTVSATVWEMGEAEALVLERSLRTQEGETALEQGWLLAELHERFGLSLEELARRFERSVSWVSRRLGLVKELPESVQQWVRRGQIGAHLATKYLVPMARAKPRDCEHLAAAVAKEKFTSQEVATLYAAWRDGPRRLRSLVLENPKLFLRAHQEFKREEPAEKTPLLQDLELIAAMARRASPRFDSALLDPEEHETLKLALKQALFDLGRLSQRMEKEENSHVESKPENGHFGASSQGDSQASDLKDPGSVPRSAQEGHPLTIGPGPDAAPATESRILSATDPGAVRCVRGQPGPSP